MRKMAAAALQALVGGGEGARVGAGRADLAMEGGGRAAVWVDLYRE